MMELVETWLKDVHGALGGEPATVSDVRIGVFYTAIQLTSGHVGVAVLNALAALAAEKICVVREP